MPFENRPLFPFTAEVNERDHLSIGGCDTAELASEFGTPLLVFDDATLRGMCRGIRGRVYVSVRQQRGGLRVPRRS